MPLSINSPFKVIADQQKRIAELEKLLRVETKAADHYDKIAKDYFHRIEKLIIENQELKHHIKALEYI